MIARVVTKRDDARLATLAAALAGAFLALVLGDDVFHARLFQAPDRPMYLAVALAIALGGLAPWLASSRRRGRTVPVRCEDGVVHAGELRIAAADVRALSIAHGAHGRSVAVEHGKKKLAFLEVERAEDATRIAETLGVARPPVRGVSVEPASRVLALPQALLTLVALVFAPLYYMAATRGYVPSSFVPDEKLLFGLGGVVAVELSVLVFSVRRLWPNQAMTLGRRSAFEAHAALHRDQALREAREKEASTADDAGPTVRIGNLERGDEHVGAWLSRIDAIPVEQHAYRGDALKKDVLWDTLGDASAATDARMAAARVLRRRYGEDGQALVRVVGDPDVRVRVEAALEEHDEAERRLETLGPLFRAR